MKNRTILFVQSMEKSLLRLQPHYEALQKDRDYYLEQVQLGKPDGLKSLEWSLDVAKMLYGEECCYNAEWHMLTSKQMKKHREGMIKEYSKMAYEFWPLLKEENASFFSAYMIEWGCFLYPINMFINFLHPSKFMENVTWSPPVFILKLGNYPSSSQLFKWLCRCQDRSQILCYDSDLHMQSSNPAFWKLRLSFVCKAAMEESLVLVMMRMESSNFFPVFSKLMRLKMDYWMYAVHNTRDPSPLCWAYKTIKGGANDPFNMARDIHMAIEELTCDAHFWACEFIIKYDPYNLRDLLQWWARLCYPLIMVELVAKELEVDSSPNSMEKMTSRGFLDVMTKLLGFVNKDPYLNMMLDLFENKYGPLFLRDNRYPSNTFDGWIIRPDFHTFCACLC